MTERDLIREVVEKSITRTVDIEDLRKEIKPLLNEAIKNKHKTLGRRQEEYWDDMVVTYTLVLRIIDEMEKNG